MQLDREQAEQIIGLKQQIAQKLTEKVVESHPVIESMNPTIVRYGLHLNNNGNWEMRVGHLSFSVDSDEMALEYYVYVADSAYREESGDHDTRDMEIHQRLAHKEISMQDFLMLKEEEDAAFESFRLDYYAENGEAMLGQFIVTLHTLLVEM